MVGLIAVAMWGSEVEMMMSIGVSVHEEVQSRVWNLYSRNQ